VVALPVRHRLCAQPRVTFAELAAEDLIAYRENSALRRRLERRMAERGLEPRRQSPAGKAFLKVALEYAERTAPTAALRAA
jgi:DNA-binding transcriptional LysR family regulator